MKQEIITNLLDTISFFMVTIDLYGRARFEQLAARMRDIKVSPFDPLFDLRGKNPDQPHHLRLWRVFFIPIATIVLGSVLVMLLVVAQSLRDGISWAQFAEYLRQDGPISITLAAGVAVLVYYGEFPLALSRHLIRLLVVGILKIYSPEGVLVFVGALLFLVSRSIAIFAAIQP